MLKTTTRVGVLAMAFLLASPTFALACAVCGAVQEEATRKAFVGTTAFMTFLALGVVFVLVGWFIRRTLQHEEEECQRARAAHRNQALDRTG
ncbi:MAG: hypothetical protein VX252_00520 [Myxococcota bacterium]|nr:hypothetical protein [Myxococcota bacterium]